MVFSSKFFQNILIPLGYFFFFLPLFIAILSLSGNLDLLKEASFLSWDAAHYEFISKNGYIDFRVAFFPIFPLLWKLFHFSVFGISIFNLFIYIFSFTILSTELNFSKKEMLLLLSFPSLIFMHLPYPEALFYLFGTILIMGLIKRKNVLVFVGLFLCCMTKPAASVLVPAILAFTWLERKIRSGSIKLSLFYIAFTALSLLCVFLIQRYYTGKWFIYFESFKIWDANYKFPLLPFTSWAGGTIVRLDATALVVGLVAIAWVFAWFFNSFRNKIITISPEIIFSTLYLAGICLLILSLLRGGSLHSLNRFIYATPFFTVFAHFIVNKVKLNSKQILWFIISTSILWLFFNSWVHIQTFFKFLVLTLYLTSFLLISSEKKIVHYFSFSIFLITNISFQLYFFYRFLKGEWVG